MTDQTSQEITLEQVINDVAVYLAELDGVDEDTMWNLIYEGYPPEPWGEVWQKYLPEAEKIAKMFQSFQPKQSQSYGDALERAAQICESVNNFDNPMTATDCARAIRNLVSKDVAA